MASFNFQGADELLKEFERMGADLSERGPAMAMAGGRAAVAEMEKRVPVRTGGLKGHIAIKGPFHTTMDGYYVDVFPDGTKKNGRKRERYAAIGYILEYGRSNMAARPWMRPAVEEGADASNEAMANARTDSLEGCA